MNAHQRFSGDSMSRPGAPQVSTVVAGIDTDEGSGRGTVRGPGAVPRALAEITRTTVRTVLLAALAAGTVLLGGCDADGDGFDDTTGEPVVTTRSGDVAAGEPSLGTATADTTWVVVGVGYAGPRGGPGRHYVMCVPDWALGSDPRAAGHGLWKEVDIPRDDGSLEEGDPCPPGGMIYDDGPFRSDGEP